MNSECWITRESTQYPSKLYTINVEKGESKWGLIPNDLNPLPIGWEAHKSKSGRIYYANSEQKKSQWEIPTEKDPELPKNWNIKKSSKCKQIYYHNTINDKTQWNFPDKHLQKAVLDAKKRQELINEEKSRQTIKSIQESEEKQESIKEVQHILALQEKQRKEQLEKSRVAEIELAMMTQKIKDTQEARLKVLSEAYIRGSGLNLNPDKVKINWLSNNGIFELSSGGNTKDGRYFFNPDTLEIITELERVQKKSSVMIAKCNAPYESMRELLKNIEESKDPTLPKDIEIVLSNVQDIIQGTDKGERYSIGRHKMIVLPSQLNGAEYLSQKKDNIVKELNEYLTDYTGGPRGQLAADPGVAQFIIDNAFNENLLDRSYGINNVKEMGIDSYLDGDNKDTLGPIYLINGYLQVKDTVTTDDVAKFIKSLPKMTIMGVRDVPVRGLDKNYNFIKVKDPVDTVDLIYASAVPLNSYGNPNTKNVIAIANLTIFSQYLGAMRLAVLRGNCDLYLMPLGGNAFKNKFDHIKAAIAMAYNVMKSDLKEKGINVKVLVWEGDYLGNGQKEREAFGFYKK